MPTVVYCRVDCIVGGDLSEYDSRCLRGIVERLLSRAGLWSVTSDCPTAEATCTLGSPLQMHYDRLVIMVLGIVAQVGYDELNAYDDIIVRTTLNGRCIYLELK